LSDFVVALFGCYVARVGPPGRTRRANPGHRLSCASTAPSSRRRKPFRKDSAGRCWTHAWRQSMLWCC